jgi:hypothetical protein
LGITETAERIFLIEACPCVHDIKYCLPQSRWLSRDHSTEQGVMLALLDVLSDL